MYLSKDAVLQANKLPLMALTVRIPAVYVANIDSARSVPSEARVSCSLPSRCPLLPSHFVLLLIPRVVFSREAVAKAAKNGSCARLLILASLLEHLAAGEVGIMAHRRSCFDKASAHKEESKKLLRQSLIVLRLG